MPNPNGSPENLLPGTARPLQPSFRHGAFAKIRLPLTVEEVEEVDGLLELRHTVPPDRAAAEEMVRLRSMIACLDAVNRPRLRLHDLRHAAAFMWISEGLPVTWVSRQLGHANPAITLSVYARLFDKAQHADRARDVMESRHEAMLANPSAVS